MKKYLLIISALLLSWSTMAQKENHPFSDDKLLHFGGFIGVNFPSYIIESPNDIISVPNVGYGLSIGGYVDLRLCRYLTIQVNPSINFNTITLQHDTTSTTEQLTMPISIPLHLKWAAERETNYRPYIIVGGGVSFDMNNPDENKKVYTKTTNYFVDGGFGCDCYTKWFRCSPEIKYQIGFNNMVLPEEKWGENGHGWVPPENDYQYMDNIGRMLYHQISLIINFGSL